jgi:tRNA threonylcarbamoyl adenosine modification protein (Sua5/YciO/YrdC/YwlC family)
VAALERGGLAVIPTDTVYGVVAAADRVDAVERIFALKERATSKSLQLLVEQEDAIEIYGHPSREARRLASRYWPGPLTIVVRASERAPNSVLSGLTIGLRMPDHAIALEIIRSTGPLAASSANRSGEPTPGSLVEIRSTFGSAIDVYVDGGTIVGRASTVVDVTRPDPVVLREGAIAADEIMRVAGFGFETG